MSIIMKTNPVVWFEIYVNDLQRAKKFYETVFNTKLSELPVPEGNGDMQMFSFPMEMNGEGAAGALIKMKGVEPGAGGTLVYFGSEDCAIEEGRIEKAGGNISQSKQSLGEYGFMVLASDTEGNMFGIHSQK